MELQGARVLVTGGHGFLGRRVCARLQELGAIVLAPPLAELDLLERDAVRAYLAGNAPDAIVHLAARVGGIGLNQKMPGTLFYENLMMGAQLLEEARRARTQKIVAVATVCAYPKHAPVPFSEDALWDGYPEETNAPYGLAKKMLLVQAQAYRAEFGTNACVVFPANMYGPGDSFDLANGHVVPSMIRRFIEAEAARAPSVTLWGDGSPTREFLYVDDGARAVALALERYDSSEPLNLGTGVEIAMKDLAHQVATQVGYKGDVVWDTSRPNGQPRRRLDTSRARDRIGFVAETPFEEGLRRTIEWYRAELAKGAR